MRLCQYMLSAAIAVTLMPSLAVAAGDDSGRVAKCRAERNMRDYYPSRAINQGIVGRVLLEAEVAKDGSLRKPRVLQSEVSQGRPEILEKPAGKFFLETFKCEKPQPAASGEPKALMIRLSVIFRMKLWSGRPGDAGELTPSGNHYEADLQVEITGMRIAST